MATRRIGLGVIIASVVAAVLVMMVLKNRSTPLSPIDNPPLLSPTSREWRIEEVAHGLEVPWSIAFTSPDRILVTERPGRIRLIENGALRARPLVVFDDVSMLSEEGLMGLVVDPDYTVNRYVYASYAYRENGKMYVQVVRLRDEGTVLTQDRVIIDTIPAAKYHAGSRIKFGPDRKLYITTGDGEDINAPQNKNSLAGKILRLNPDGSIPEDNPFPHNPVWSYGHRNSQGLDWHKETGELYASEHGPTLDGPEGGDEINRILKGAHYGWPLVSHENRLEGTIAPIILFTPAEAPSGLIVYSGIMLPQFKNNLFFGALKGEGLIRLVVDDNNPDVIRKIEKLEQVRYGRIREVVESPDGSIYFTTSNRDGRGNPNSNDDKIFRIVAVE